MNLLAIETSSKVGSVAALEWTAGGDPQDVSIERRDGIDFPEGTRHGKALVPSIQKLMKRMDWSPEDIDVVAVSIGPGSYTGLRVGLVCAKMISVLSNADLVAVPSLDVIARNVGLEAERICVLVDARRGEVYAASYERQGGIVCRRSGYGMIGKEQAAELLQDGVCILGDGVPVVRSAVDGGSVLIVPEEEWIPRADFAAEIGAGLYAQGTRHDPYTTEPMYVRKPAAEEKWAEDEAASE